MDLFGLIGALLAAGVSIFLTVTIMGVVGIALLAWGISSVVRRLTGKSGSKKNLPAGSDRSSKRIAAQPAHVVRDYEYLDVEAGTTADEVHRAMEAYEGAPYVGEYARAVMGALDKAEFRLKGLSAAIDREFEPNTMTWDRFMAPVEVAMDGILQNCVQMANRVQGFDVSEYERLTRLEKVSAIEEGSSNAERLKLFERTIDEMRELREANDQLLFELEKLQDELSKLSEAGGGSSTDDIAEEIRKLAEDAKYYS